MAKMTPDEFQKNHGLKPEFLKPYCQEWLCQQYNNDLEIWLQEGSPSSGTAYNNVTRDVAAMQHLGCKCLIE